jgi:hypothetical protein
MQFLYIFKNFLFLIFLFPGERGRPAAFTWEQPLRNQPEEQHSKKAAVAVLSYSYLYISIFSGFYNKFFYCLIYQYL